jgi:hypothetical protein
MTQTRMLVTITRGHADQNLAAETRAIGDGAQRSSCAPVTFRPICKGTK